MTQPLGKNGRLRDQADIYNFVNYGSTHCRPIPDILNEILVPSELFHDVKDANWFLEKGKQWKRPKQLWKSLWYDGEVAVLFADTNIGKSIYAIQIANAIAGTGERVLYFDFEMSSRQFYSRFSDPDTGEMFQFNEGFLRTEPDRSIDYFGDMDYCLGQILRACDMADCNKIVIDNVSWLLSNAANDSMAGRFMNGILDFKWKEGISSLLIAHTPKRKLSDPLDQNSLAGAKKIANFADSMFAIGQSAHADGGRYIKQLKVRSGGIEYGKNNVILCRLVKEGANLHFVEDGFAPEQTALTGIFPLPEVIEQKG